MRSTTRPVRAAALALVLVTMGTWVPAAATGPAEIWGMGSDQGTGQLSGTTCDRQVVVDAWATGGTRVRTAAHKVLIGTDAEVCQFLENEYQQLDAIDDRVAVGQMKAAGGPQTARAANEALRSDGEGAVARFLESGWQQPRLIDLRGRVLQMKQAGGPKVQAAAQAALDDGSLEAMDTFMASGWVTPHTIDQRVTVNRAMSEGGPQVRAAAQRALDDGTLQGLNRFIEVDWGVAQARDEELETLVGLRATAVAAGKRAALETTAAVAQTERALAEAAAAKAAAEAARDRAAAAGHETDVARAEARAAAIAADHAARAAEVAVAAARAAGSAARTAAGAAARAATAAARAEGKASEAWASAQAAELDRGAAADALAAAQEAEQMDGAALGLVGAPNSNPLYWVDQAVSAYQDADRALVSVRAHTADAAAAAVAAGGFAGQASEEAALASAAAQRARANAERAREATVEAARYADAAAAASAGARAAAERAVTHAEAAAAAARDAAAHAGEAVDAAERATDHANAAMAAADQAVTAAELARDVYTTAREADEIRLRDELEQGLALARQAQDAVSEAESGELVTPDGPMSQFHTAALDRLIAEASDPATDLQTAARKGREVARALAVVPGSWTSQAALRALGAQDDLAVVEFVRDLLPLAEAQDDRANLMAQMVTGTSAMRRAAQAALDGTDADVARFLTEPAYPERVLEDRAMVNRLLSEGEVAGKTAVVSAAQDALDDGSGAALRRFIEEEHSIALTIDARVAVNRIASDPESGTEVRNTAQIALEGPAAFVVNFLEVGQHQAAQRDFATATHNLVASSLMIQTAKVAAAAVDTARTAQSAAATARGAADAAIAYAKQATAAARQAADYATEAVGYAEDAAESAQSAAASVRRAAAAAQQASRYARQASASASWARASAVAASRHAASAYAAYEAAFAAAIATGKDRDEALLIAQGMLEERSTTADEAVRALMSNLLAECERQGNFAEQCVANAWALGSDPDRYQQEKLAVCESSYEMHSNAYIACAAAALSPVFERVVSEIDTLIESGQDWLKPIDTANGFAQGVAAGAANTAWALYLGCNLLCGPAILTAEGVAVTFEFFALTTELLSTVGKLTDPLTDNDPRLNGGRVSYTYLQQRVEAAIIEQAADMSRLAGGTFSLRGVPCVGEDAGCPYDWIKDIQPAGPTHGYIVDHNQNVLDANGLPIANPPDRDDIEAWLQYSVASGDHEDLNALRDRLARLYAEQFGVGLAPPANHLEVQLAYEVATRDVALQDSVLRLVINNADGVCAPLDGGDQLVPACLQAIQMLLPEGTSMVIYYPNPIDPQGDLLQVRVRGTGDWIS